MVRPPFNLNAVQSYKIDIPNRALFLEQLEEYFSKESTIAESPDGHPRSTLYDKSVEGLKLDQDLLDAVHNEILKAINHYIMPDTKAEIINTWFNHTLAGERVPRHAHIKAEHLINLVGVLYITAPAGCGHLVFTNHEDGSEHIYEVHDNQLVVFPGHMYHHTEVSTVNEPRIIMAVDFANYFK